VTKDEFIDFMHRNDKRTRKIFDSIDTDRDGKLTVSDIINHAELRHLNIRMVTQFTCTQNCQKHILTQKRTIQYSAYALIDTIF